MTLSEEIVQLQRRVSESTARSSDLLRLAQLKFVEVDHDFGEIQQLLHGALELNGGNVDAMFWMAHLLYMDLADLEACERWLADALAVDGTRSDCLSLLGSCKIQSGRPMSDYVQHLRDAIKYQPTWVMPRIVLAVAMHRNGKKSEATKLEEEAALFAGCVVGAEDPVARYYEQVVTGRAKSLGELQEIVKLGI